MKDEKVLPNKNFINTSALIPALTGYRAIAAWMIFVYHFMPFNSPSYPMWMKKIVWNFHMGVDLFFVLSGFLIAYRYYEKTPLDLKKYFINRFARIYPVYFLLTIMVFVVWYYLNREWSTFKTLEVITSLTLTKSLFAEFKFAGIPQGWTLTLEEIFYFTAPFSFLLIKRRRLFLIIIPILFFVLGELLALANRLDINTYGFMKKNIFKFFIEFYAGVSLAYILLKTKIAWKRNFLTYFGLLFMVGYFCVTNFFKPTTNWQSFIDLGILSFFGIVPILWGLITEKTIIQKVLGHPYFVLLGKSSYVFYLIHKGYIPIFINDYISGNKLVIFVLLNILSILIFKYIEEPLNLYIRRKFSS